MTETNKFLDQNGLSYLWKKIKEMKAAGVAAEAANNSQIDARTETAGPITPFNLDYAIKAALCDNKGELWTKDEQFSARIRLGIEEKPTDMQLEEFLTKYYATKKNGKIYQTKIWKFAANPSSEGEKLLDNTNLVFEPSTDSFEGRDDYLNGQNPLFEWMYVNYKRYPDGTAYPVALEGTPEFKTTGDVDVGAMQMEFYWNVQEFDEYFLYTISDSPNEDYGLVPWIEGIRADGTVLPWCIGSAYYSGIASDGLLRSQPNLPLKNFQGFNSTLESYPKKGSGYHGAGVERNTFLILFNAIKGATKSSQTLYQGCSYYSFQFPASIKRDTLESYFPVTNEQAQHFIVGSGMWVGYSIAEQDSLNPVDRGQSTMHAYTSKIAKVLKVEPIDNDNYGIYLDCEPFPTADVSTNGIVSPVYISSMPWHSGSTNKVIGKHDGSYLSNTDGRMPYRVQGREYQVGCSVVSSNAVLINNDNNMTDIYIAPKGILISNDTTDILNNWKKLGTIPIVVDSNEDLFWVGDIAINVETAGWYPSVLDGGSVQGTGDRCYLSNTKLSTSFGSLGFLWYNVSAGSSCFDGRQSLSNRPWFYGSAD